jgi:hypothetical protein
MVIVTFVLFIYACTKDSRMQGAANAQTAKTIARAATGLLPPGLLLQTNRAY